MDAFPIAINSLPVSYDVSDLLKYSVSFSYVRYVRERMGSRVAPQIREDPQGGTVVGVVNLDNGKFQVDRLINGSITTQIVNSLPESGPVSRVI